MTAPHPPDTDEVALLVGAAMDRAGVPYMITGSVASTLLGEPRATNDIDVVLELPDAQVHALAEELGPDFAVDEESLRSAFRAGRSWNFFYLPYVTKVDLFPRKHGPFDEAAFDRRHFRELRPDGAGLFVMRAEDLILQKLLWYREGGEISIVQWRDVLGVLHVSGPTLDRDHLATWAAGLGIRDLLERALAEAGI